MGRSHPHALGFHPVQRGVGIWLCTLSLVLFGTLTAACGVNLERHDDSHLGRIQWCLGLERTTALAGLGCNGPDDRFDCQRAVAQRAQDLRLHQTGRQAQVGPGLGFVRLVAQQISGRISHHHRYTLKTLHFSTQLA